MGPSSPRISSVRISDRIARLRVELPGHPLGHMNSYAVRTASGVALIDVGWSDERYTEALSAALADEFGLATGDVGDVLITHSHPDHLGAAGRVQRAAGARVGMSSREWASMVARYGDLDRTRRRLADWVEQAGAPDVVRAQLDDQVDSSAARVSELARVDPDLVAAGAVGLDGVDLEVVPAPGHTPGHTCFALPSERVVFTGDHLLERGTAGPGYMPPISEGDVLDSLRSLRWFARRDGYLGLPGHGEVIRDVAARARAVRALHQGRMRELLERLSVAVSGGSAWQLAALLSRKTAWYNLSPRLRIAATAQTVAYLRALEQLGLASSSGSLWSGISRADRVEAALREAGV